MQYISFLKIIPAGDIKWALLYLKELLIPNEYLTQREIDKAHQEISIIRFFCNIHLFPL